MRYRFLIIILLKFCLFATRTSSAQQRISNYIVYGKENGLGQSVYHDVFETSDGYLWAGSNNGLYRFDGRRFEHIINVYNNPNSPSDNINVDFEEDNNGNLWIAGFNKGLTCYNLKSGRFKQYPRLSKDISSNTALFCITKDSDKNLWIGTAGYGMTRYLPEKDSFEFFYPDPSKHTDGSARGENWVSGITEDNTDKNILWLSAFDGLYRFDKRTKKFEKFTNTIISDNGNPQVMAFFCIEQYGDKLYMGTWFQGLVIFDKIKKTFQRVPYVQPGHKHFIYGILDLQIADDVLYMAAMNDGLLGMKLTGTAIEPMLQTKDIKLSNTEINIQRVSLTRHAGFFAGGNSSLYQLNNKQNKLHNYFNINAPKVNPESNQGMFSIIADNKNNGYWCAVFNYAGILWYNNSFDKPVLYNNDNKEKQEYFTDLVQDANGKLWCTSRYGGVFTFVPGIDKSPTRLTGNNMFTKKIFVEEAESSNGRQIWFTSKQAAYLLDVAAGSIVTFDYPVQEITKYSKEGIRFLNSRADSKNNLWIATNAGLLKLEPQTHKTNYFYTGNGDTTGLAGNQFKSIAIDRQDNIWLGYFNEGLQVFDGKILKVVEEFNINNGLPSMEVNYISCDTGNNILACFHNGLAIYNRRIKQWQQVNVLDGLKSDYLDVPVFSFTNGTNLLGQKKNNLLVFATQDLLQQTAFLSTHISSLKVNGQVYRSELLPDYISKVTLPYSTRDIQIEFAATDWNFPFRTNYYYRVDGIHKEGEWLPRQDAAVSLTGLPPGNYTFRFYAITNDGVKTGEKKLQINITPPFYKTVWFVGLLSLAVTALLWGLYRYRINQIKKLNRVRNNISRDLHDDIGASLSNINILNEMAKRNVHQPEKSKEYLEKAGEDIQRISESLSDIVWNINPRYDDIGNLFIRMKRYAADMLDGKNISYEMEFPENEDKLSLPMEKRRDMYLIFKEAVNNLAKYSMAAKAFISVRNENGMIRLQVKDDGKGFDTEKMLPGNGMANMKQRALASGAILNITSEPGKGTGVELLMNTT